MLQKPQTLSCILSMLLLLHQARLQVATKCHQAITNCDTCSDDYSLCVSCRSGYFLLSIPGDGAQLCVDNCARFATHLPDLLHHTCIPGMASLMPDCNIDCNGSLCSSDKNSCLDPQSSTKCPPWSLKMPDNTCSAFGCPTGYFRHQSGRQCQECHAACNSCTGPQAQDCSVCSAGMFLNLNELSASEGTCEPKTQDVLSFSLVVSNLFSVIEDGRPNQLRDGSLLNPFVDLRDALSKAEELAAPYSHASVAIYLTRGDHFLLEEPLSNRYVPIGTHSDRFKREFSLTIQPLPCDFASGVERYCAQEGEKVSLIVKIGAYFRLPLSLHTLVQNIEFDFTDSLLRRESPCLRRRAKSCEVIEGTNGLLKSQPLQADCECQPPTHQASLCNFNHPVSLFSPIVRNSPGKVWKLRIESSSFINIFTNFNSLVDLAIPIDLEVVNSLFKDISTCGSLFSSQIDPPIGTSYPSSLLSSFIEETHHEAIEGQKIDIRSSEFQNIGSEVQYASPSDLKQSHFQINNHTSSAPVLNVNSFPGQVRVANSSFSACKLALDLTTQVDPLLQQVASGSLLLAKYDLLQQSLIQIRNHEKGVILEGNQFKNNTVLSGLITIELAPGIEKGALLIGNQFYFNSGWKYVVILNLQSKHDPAQDSGCSGFHLLRNIFAQNAHLPGQTSLVKLACIPHSFKHVDGNSDLSAMEASSLVTIPAFQLSSKTTQYSLTSGQAIELDDALTSLRNNTFSENFRGNSYGQCLSILLMRGLHIEGLHFYRNGDIGFSENISRFLVQRGAHAALQREGLMRGELEVPSHTQVRDELMVIIKSQELKIAEVEFKQNWLINPSLAARLVHCIECEAFSIDRLTMVRIYSSLSPLLRDYILTLHDFSENRVIVPDHDPYEKVSGELVRGNVISLSNSRIQEVHLGGTWFQLETGLNFSVVNCSFYEARGLGIVYNSFSFQRGILQRSSFRNVQFQRSWMFPAYFEMTDCILQNTGLSSLQFLSRILQVFFFTRNIILNTQFVNPCGSAVCETQLFLSVSHTNSFQFYNCSFTGMRVLTEDAIVRMSGCSVLFQDCTFIKNQGFTGGVIRVSPLGKLTILNSHFIGNSAKSGGVIYFQGPATLTIQNSHFERNKATNSGGVFFFTEESRSIIKNSTFVRNKSAQQSSVGHFEGVAHSAFTDCRLIENEGEGSFTIFKSKVDFNGITYSGNTDILGQSSPLLMISSDISILNSTFSNQGYQGEHCIVGATNYGGFLHDLTSNTLNISDSRFSHVCAYEGGVIYMNQRSEVRVTGCTFKKCRART